MPFNPWKPITQDLIEDYAGPLDRDALIREAMALGKTELYLSTGEIVKLTKEGGDE